MATGTWAAAIRGFTARLGQQLVSPRAALERVESEGGGFRDALLLTLLGVVGFRFPQLAEAVLGLEQLSQGTLLRLVGVVSNELNETAMVVIPAALALTVLAGRRRDPSVDLELGAACYAPFFVARGLVRALNAVMAAFGAGTLPGIVGYLPATVAALFCFARALQVVRSRPDRGQTPPAVTPEAADKTVVGGLAARVGFAALALIGVAFAGNVFWASRNVESLRPIKQGKLAPDFQLPRIDGMAGVLALSSLRGKVVLLDFWATWCAPCLEMIPVLDDLHKEWSPRGVEFVGVNSEGGQASTEEIRAFVRNHPSRYPMVIDDGRANALYRIRALPQMVLIGKDGTLIKSFLGVTTRDDIAKALSRAVGPAQ